MARISKREDPPTGMAVVAGTRVPNTSCEFCRQPSTHRLRNSYREIDACSKAGCVAKAWAWAGNHVKIARQKATMLTAGNTRYPYTEHNLKKKTSPIPLPPGPRPRARIAAK